MAAVTSMKRWFLFNLRRAVGTQVLIEQFILQSAAAPRASAGRDAAPPAEPPAPPMAVAAANKLHQLFARIAESSETDEQLGFRRDQVPVLIDLNGDLVWLPGDLLKYLWHTRHALSPAFIVHLLAETQHYMWIRERLRPGDTAIDCGANLGMFSTMMAERVGSTGAIHSFEPSPPSRRDLERVLRLNQLSWVTISPCAVADKPGKATFCEVLEADVRREASHLASATRWGFTGTLAHQTIEVDVTTIDRYVAEKSISPRLVKIDVEGAELDVLEGARECVSACRPLLVIEIHPDSHTGQFDHERLQSYLRQYGYAWKAENRCYYCEPV